MIDYEMLNRIANDFLYKTMPLLIAMAIGFMIYSLLHKKFNITEWISLRIKVTQEWKPVVCFLSMLLFQFIIALVGIHIIDIPSIIYFIISGLVTGSTFAFISKINVNKKNTKI